MSLESLCRLCPSCSIFTQHFNLSSTMNRWLSYPIYPRLFSFIDLSTSRSYPCTNPAHTKFRWYYSPYTSFLLQFTHQIQAGTMFELVKALNEGAETLKNQTSNSISLNAGCELFIAFVTLFPHDSAVCHFCTFFITLFSYRSVRTSLI